MWFTDEAFLAGLDSEGLGTDENPLDDDVLDLMSRVWVYRDQLRDAQVKLARQHAGHKGAAQE